MEDRSQHIRNATGKLYYAGEVFLTPPFKERCLSRICHDKTFRAFQPINLASNSNRRNFKRHHLCNDNPYSH